MNFSEFVQCNSLELDKKEIIVNELVSFLHSSPNITKLSLKDCKIDDEGAKALNLKKLACSLYGNKTNIKGKEDFDITSLIKDRSGPPIEIFDPAKLENKTTFDDIIISESLKKELKKICGFMSEEKKTLLQKLGCKPQKGYIFYGPPGNGKTKIARAIACQANAKFISISASEFLKSYLGESEAYVRKLFQEARANAPCIVFIDEIDCIAKERGSGGNSVQAQSCDSLVNQLLAELDGFKPLEGVTVIAATNRKGILDSALTRPGRLSKHIEIPLPNKSQRKRILDLYIKKLKSTGYLEGTIDTQELVGETNDFFSGADLEYVVSSTVDNAVYNTKEGEEKVIVNTSDFINTIKDFKKNKSQEPEDKQVNDVLELLNKSVLSNCSGDVHSDNENNVESCSSANSSSDGVGTPPQLAKAIYEHTQTKINDLQKKYNEKFEELDSKNSDLERGLNCVRKDLTKVIQCTEEHTQLKDDLESMRKILGTKDGVITQLEEYNSTLGNRVEDLQKQFESKNKELNSKYEKFLEVSTNSKRQGSYASISFVLSGAFAVGASLTMFHLAVCLSLAVAALIFLTVGCYCLHKANTTLSNVEIDQTTNFVCLNGF